MLRMARSYRVDPSGKTTVFNDSITGPNGIILSNDEKTLSVAHNVAKATSKMRSGLYRRTDLPDR